VPFKLIEVSTITCPKCGHQAAEEMPTNACQFFYDCKGCGERLRPNAGDCCVFCSYGSVPCPPVQMRGCCNWSAGFGFHYAAFDVAFRGKAGMPFCTAYVRLW